MKFVIAAVCLMLIAPAGKLMAGGELSGSEPILRKGQESASFRPGTSTIEKSAIGPMAGAPVEKLAPIPAPYRPIGWGFKCTEFYGPTYYFPWKHNNYEGLDPTYYPFYHPRLWPNYKVATPYKQQCGSSRSCLNWDSYDDWSRGARYEEHQ